MTPAEQARFDAWRKQVADDAPPLSDAQAARLRQIWKPAVTGNAAPARTAETAPVPHERYSNATA